MRTIPLLARMSLLLSLIAAGAPIRSASRATASPAALPYFPSGISVTLT